MSSGPEQKTRRPEQRQEDVRAEALAERLGTSIPGVILMTHWPLPILEAIVDRIEDIERRIGDGEEK